jgi:hypothetical protein
MAKKPTPKKAAPAAEPIPELEDAPEAEPEETEEPPDENMGGGMPDMAALSSGIGGAPEPEPDTRELDDAMKVLREQAATLDLTVDPAWDADTLAAKVLEAQEAKDAADKAAFDAAAKERVFLLRDAWPVADEKHLAGDTIEVPHDIAVKWYVAGVARPA